MTPAGRTVSLSRATLDVVRARLPGGPAIRIRIGTRIDRDIGRRRELGSQAFLEACLYGTDGDRALRAAWSEYARVIDHASFRVPDPKWPD